MPDALKPARYTAPAVMLHWLMALLIAAGFGLAWWFDALPISPGKLKVIAWHKWAGVTVFALALVRVAWRVTHRPPPLPASTPAWQRKAAAAGHALLYVLIFLVPLSGWLQSSAKGYPTVYLGWLPLPDAVGKDKPLADLFHQAHEVLTTALLVLVALHVAAALKHHFVDRDGLLRRMTVGRADGR